MQESGLKDKVLSVANTNTNMNQPLTKTIRINMNIKRSIRLNRPYLYNKQRLWTEFEDYSEFFFP